MFENFFSKKRSNSSKAISASASEGSTSSEASPVLEDKLPTSGLQWSDVESSAKYEDRPTLEVPSSGLTLETVFHYLNAAKNWAKRNPQIVIPVTVVSCLAVGIGITIATMGVGPVVAAAIVAGVAIKSSLVISGVKVGTAVVTRPIWDGGVALGVVGVVGASIFAMKGCFFGEKTTSKEDPIFIPPSLPGPVYHGE